MFRSESAIFLCEKTKKRVAADCMIMHIKEIWRRYLYEWD